MSENIQDTLKERGARYGTLMDNGAISQHFKAVARMKYPEPTQTSWEKMEPDQQQALDVIFDKISRILTGDPAYDDNWRDIAGYATLVLDRLTKEKT